MQENHFQRRQSLGSLLSSMPRSLLPIEHPTPADWGLGRIPFPLACGISGALFVLHNHRPKRWSAVLAAIGLPELPQHPVQTRTIER